MKGDEQLFCCYSTHGTGRVKTLPGEMRDFVSAFKVCELQSEEHTYPCPFQMKNSMIIGDDTFLSWNLSQKFVFRHLLQPVRNSALSSVWRFQSLYCLQQNYPGLVPVQLFFFSHKFFLITKILRSVYSLDELTLLGENNCNFRDSWSIPSAHLYNILCSSAKSGFLLK